MPSNNNLIDFLPTAWTSEIKLALEGVQDLPDHMSHRVHICLSIQCMATPFDQAHRCVHAGAIFCQFEGKGEGYLLEVEGVEEIAVVGYPDDRLVEVPVAFVVSSTDLSAEALIERCRGKIASFKIPRHIIFIDEMPSTPSGKIRKIELREWALQKI